jgi:hypothetical protein
MTTSSGLGPAKGLVVAGVAVAVYGSVKRLAGRLVGKRSLEPNIVLAKAEGFAWSKSKYGVERCALSFPPGSFSVDCGALKAFSCEFEFFLFRSGNPREGCLTEDGGLVAPGFCPCIWSVRESSAIGFSNSDAPFDFSSCALFFRAAARACNFDILGAPFDEPPRRPPRGYRGAMKRACRSTGMLSHGASLKNSENEKGFLLVFEHPTIRAYQ